MIQTIEQYEDGQPVFRQGDVGDRMYVVVDGAVRIFREDDGAETTLATVGPNETFGELSLFDQHPRSACATAVGDTRLRVITQEEFMSLDGDLLLWKLLLTLAERLRTLGAAYERLSNYGTADPEIVRLLRERDWVD